MSIGYKWWGKSKSIDSPGFKQASKDLLNSAKAFEKFMYLSSIESVEIEKEFLRNI